MGDHEQRLEEILAEWDLDSNDNSVDTYSIDLSQVYSNVSLSSPYTVGTGINFPNTIYTTTGTTSSPWATYNPNTISSKIKLDGKDADIEINGVSLWATMQEIANRLNIMQTNPELETEWKELRELGDQYRKLEQHILDKQATWDKLKAMPAPDVD
jgi:hypothetical protein